MSRPRSPCENAQMMAKQSRARSVGALGACSSHQRSRTPPAPDRPQDPPWPAPGPSADATRLISTSAPLRVRSNREALHHCVRMPVDWPLLEGGRRGRGGRGGVWRRPRPAGPCLGPSRSLVRLGSPGWIYSRLGAPRHATPRPDSPRLGSPRLDSGALGFVCCLYSAAALRPSLHPLQGCPGPSGPPGPCGRQARPAPPRPPRGALSLPRPGSIEYAAIPRSQRPKPPCLQALRPALIVPNFSRKGA